jgi:carboxyl-terminal processing protease
MSASASEILIGALRDHGRALVVGAETTYGKGSVQAAIDMNQHFKSFRDGKDLGAAYITIQKWYLPTGSSTQLRGVPSDIRLVGLDECFHHREADCPHALGWDTIPPADFGSVKSEIDRKSYVSDGLIAQLATMSMGRQETMEEFAILRDRVERFDRIANKKEVPLKISTLLTEKLIDDAIIDEIGKRIKILAETEKYPCEDIDLPDVKGGDDGADGDCGREKEDVDGIAIFDTNLRESLRIVADWVEILHSPKFNGRVLLTPTQKSDPQILR